MSEWKETPIKDFGRVITGFTPSTNNLNLWGGEVPFYSPADFNENVYCSVTERTVNPEALSNDRIVQANSLMVTCIASIGKIALAKRKGISNQQINTIIFNDDFEPEYCYYLVKYNINELLKLAGTTAVPIVNKAEFEKIKLKHHSSRNEQRQIARILSTCDAVIEKTQATIDKYKAIKQGMLHDLFTRGIDPTTGKLRPKYEDAPELYKESKLGMMPKEWEVDTLGKVCEVTSSKRIYMNEYVDYGIPFYRSLEIILKSKDQEIGTTLYISNDRYEDIEKQFGVPKHGDILITSVGTLGISYRVKENDLFYFKDGNLIWFRKFSDIEYSRFLLHSLDELIRLQFDRITIGTSQKAFTIDKLKKLNIFLPKENEYKIISERIEVFNHQLQIEQTYLHKLQQIKAGLMNDLLSGKKRVKVPEEVLAVAQ